MGFYNHRHAATLTVPMPVPVHVAALPPQPVQLAVNRLGALVVAPAPAPARLGQGVTTLTLAQRNDILMQLAIAQNQAAYVQGFYNAHLNDLEIALGDMYISWGQWWGIQEVSKDGAAGVAAMLAAAPNPGGTWAWTSQEEGAYSGWTYSINQLADIVAAVTGTLKPITGTIAANQNPTPTPTTTTTTTTITTVPGGASPLAYVGLGVLGLGVLGVGGKILGLW